VNAATRWPWLVIAFGAGAVYGIIGLTTAALARGAATHQLVVIWRLAAWVASLAVFLVHIRYEHTRHSNAARAVAWHVSVGVALGALVLAVAAAIHNGRVLPLALLVWPVLLGAPAYLAALLAVAALRTMSRPNEE
jgi:hypothetical protein